MNRYALIGKSLVHSLSKEIHESFYQEFNIKASYDLVNLEENELEGFALKLKEGLYQGINITIPYKKALIKYLDYIDPKAREIGSINTILVKNNKLYGYNTDYDGFIYALKRYKLNPSNKECYILGTGGVSLTVRKALLDLNAKSVSFVSRTKIAIDTISYHELENRNIDILVNATPVGMYPNINSNPINLRIKNQVKEAMDLIYNPLETEFLRMLESKNNGLPMLLFQAYKAEEIWQNKEFSINEWLERIGKRLESNW